MRKIAREILKAEQKAKEKAMERALKKAQREQQTQAKDEAKAAHQALKVKRKEEKHGDLAVQKMIQQQSLRSHSQAPIGIIIIPSTTTSAAVTQGASTPLVPVTKVPLTTPFDSLTTPPPPVLTTVIPAAGTPDAGSISPVTPAPNTPAVSNPLSNPSAVTPATQIISTQTETSSTITITNSTTTVNSTIDDKFLLDWNTFWYRILPKRKPHKRHNSHVSATTKF